MHEQCIKKKERHNLLNLYVYGFSNQNKINKYINVLINKFTHSASTQEHTHRAHLRCSGGSL